MIKCIKKIEEVIPPGMVIYGDDRDIVVYGEHIIVLYVNVCRSIALMLIEHYDTPEYDKCVFVVNTYDEVKHLKQIFTDHKFIFYNLEPYRDTIPYFMEEAIPKLQQFDESWDYQLENVKFLRDRGITNTKFMPMRYTEALNLGYSHPKNKPYRFDLGWIGMVYNDRCKAIEYLSCTHQHNKALVMWGHRYDEVMDLMVDCKFQLNIHPLPNEIKLQEQVRIFELICNNLTVISEVSSTNYFGDLIYEFKDISEVNHIIATCEPKQNVAEIYKHWTHTDEAYETYKNIICEKYL